MALTVSLHKKSSGVTIYKVYCILNLNTKDFSRSPSNMHSTKSFPNASRVLWDRELFITIITNFLSHYATSNKKVTIFRRFN